MDESPQCLRYAAGLGTSPAGHPAGWGGVGTVRHPGDISDGGHSQGRPLAIQCGALGTSRPNPRLSPVSRMASGAGFHVRSEL